MLSGVPMVGYRNQPARRVLRRIDVIRRSDGGVSELGRLVSDGEFGCYQAFRWWGIGTYRAPRLRQTPMLSGVPMVGYRNHGSVVPPVLQDVVRRSDGGVSEPTPSPPSMR